MKSTIYFGDPHDELETSISCQFRGSKESKEVSVESPVQGPGATGKEQTSQGILLWRNVCPPDTKTDSHPWDLSGIIQPTFISNMGRDGSSGNGGPAKSPLQDWENEDQTWTQ